MSSILDEVKQLILNRLADVSGTDEILLTYDLWNQVFKGSEIDKDHAKDNILKSKALFKRYTQESVTVISSGEKSEFEGMRGATLTSNVTIRPGNSFVDLEALREALNVSEKKWEAALKAATKRRKPSVTVSVIPK